MQQDKELVTTTLEQAAHWWVVLQDEEATPTDHREFDQWVGRGADRVEAYLRVARLQRSLANRRLRWPAISPEKLIRDAKAAPEDAVPLRNASGASPTTARPRGLPAFASPRFAFGAAASLLVAFFVVLGIRVQPDQFETSLGEQRSFLLDDGSRVTLNSASSIEVDLGKHRRFIRVSRGEALFEVAHDAARPFDVETSDVVLRAVGTQFDVDRRSDRTIVTIVEGRVAMVGVAGRPDPENRRPVLVANDRVIISRLGVGEIEHGVDASAATSWIRGQLVFKNRAISEVAEEFNRYNREHIEIRGEALRNREITGTFQSNDPASIVAFLSGMEDVSITSDGRGGHLVTLDERGDAND